MSSIPGYTLESFLAWQWSLIVEGHSENNVSLGMAEALGNIKPRPVVTQEQFSTIVIHYEPYREIIEERLSAFDEENQSWRAYAEYVDCDVPAEVNTVVGNMVKELIK